MDEEQTKWWQRLAGGLKRTSSAIGTAISDLVTKQPLDPAMLDEIEEALIRADLGIEASARVRDAISQGWFKQAMSPDEVKVIIADEVEKILDAGRETAAIAGAKPFVLLVVGVNGSGKTTTDRQARGEASPPKDARSCSRPATRSAPPRSISSRSGARAPAPR